jgi:S1-C subfamily serine protease
MNNIYGGWLGMDCSRLDSIIRWLTAARCLAVAVLASVPSFAGNPGFTNFVWQPEPASSPLAAVQSVVRAPALLERQFARNLRNRMKTIEATGALSELKADGSKSRGAEMMRLYQDCSSAVVLILVGGGTGFGSGFLISEDGWLVTNQHVARDALLTDSLTREVTVILGRPGSDGLTAPVKTRFAAEVRKWDADEDLALLKLKSLPGSDELKSLRYLTISSGQCLPGEDVAAIGHAGLSLLWSMKPGQVQAVGRAALDSAEVFRMWEEQANAPMSRLLSGSFDSVRTELERETGASGRRMVIQATCPILPGDSGGPLLNMEGKVLGVTCFLRADSRGLGAVHYFLHGVDLQNFLKDRPKEALLALRSPYDSDPDAAEIRDFDGDGIADTLICMQMVPSGGTMRATLAAIGWNLTGKANLQRFVSRLRDNEGGGQRSVLDMQAMFEEKAFKFQAYLARENRGLLFAADLDDDGFFEIIRLDSDSDGLTDRQWHAAGPGKPYVSEPVKRGARLAAVPDSMPTQWQQRYTRLIQASTQGGGGSTQKTRIGQ